MTDIDSRRTSPQDQADQWQRRQELRVELLRLVNGSVELARQLEAYVVGPQVSAEPPQQVAHVGARYAGASFIGTPEGAKAYFEGAAHNQVGIDEEDDSA